MKYLDISNKVKWIVEACLSMSMMDVRDTEHLVLRVVENSA